MVMRPVVRWQEIMRVETSASKVPAGSGAAESVKHTEPVHPSRFCPNCSAELRVNHCQLSCPRCGFYLSSSDFYSSPVSTSAETTAIPSDIQPRLHPSSQALQLHKLTSSASNARQAQYRKLD